MKNKIQKFRMYRNKFKQWILDYPKYKGNLDELVFIGGASVFCDMLSEGQDEFILTVSDDRFNGALSLIRLGEDKEIGGYWYFLPSLDSKDTNLEFDDILHYQKIIVALTQTDKLMKEIDIDLALQIV